MFNLKDFRHACHRVEKRMKKNHVYTLEDLKKAIDMAVDIINKNKKYMPFSQGNNKLEKNILIFDLPSIITCKYACKRCYAQKAERLYKNTRVKRLYNMILIEYALINKDFKVYLQNLFINILEGHALIYKKAILRIHASGDLYKKEYLKLWLDICKKLEHVQNLSIYTYTKVLNNNEIDKINKKYKNFNIVKSLITVENVTYINFGNMEYLNKLTAILEKNNIEYFICDYGITNNLHCGVNCHACMSKDYDVILFKQH